MKISAGSIHRGRTLAAETRAHHEVPAGDCGRIARQIVGPDAVGEQIRLTHASIDWLI